MHASRNQSGEMRHVDQVERADFVRDLPHAGKIDDSRIGAAAADDQLRPLLLGQLFQIVVVDGFGFLGHAIRNDAVSLAGKIQMMAVSKMSAVRQIESENGVARLQHRREGLHVGLGPGVGLYVGVFRAKEFLGALPRQILHHVGKLAAAVVAFAGIAFGIFVGEDRAHGFEHSFADKVLGGDQFQAFVLAANFVIDGGSHLRIGFVERAGHAVSFHGSVLSVCLSHSNLAPSL